MLLFSWTESLPLPLDEIFADCQLALSQHSASYHTVRHTTCRLTTLLIPDNRWTHLNANKLHICLAKRLRIFKFMKSPNFVWIGFLLMELNTENIWLGCCKCSAANQPFCYFDVSSAPLSWQGKKNITVWRDFRHCKPLQRPEPRQNCSILTEFWSTHVQNSCFPLVNHQYLATALCLARNASWEKRKIFAELKLVTPDFFGFVPTVPVTNHHHHWLESHLQLIFFPARS